ncbi:Serine-threonine/tyrosine-protein kinase [Theobroma cacao]|nr:Serine-threonine/tyrosine-protein kinase [Theobroma cacao]
MEHLHFLLLVFTIFQTRLYLGTSKMGGLEGARADKEALLSFKFQVTVPQNALSGWTRNSSHCTWYGVSCSSKGSRVQSLHLSRLGLGGTLGPQLSNFTFLHTLNLSHNLFHGQIQLEFSRLQLLQQIDLKNNFINGTIPAILSTGHNLETLRLEENRFSGKLPPELGSLQKLKTLYVSINNLTGSIPRTFGNLSSLTSLNLARNQSLAEIPSELGYLRNLQYFQLSGNHLTGEIPSSVYNVSSLVFLSVTQNNLGGKLPNDIVQAPPNLRQLYLAQNSFEGIVPGSISNASGIEYLDLSMNRFHGPLVGEFPSSVANLSSNLQHFCIANNLLTGNFPQGFDKFHNLISLSIEQNAFTGEIPKNIAKLKKLQSFSVFQNMLSGEIPDIFGNLTQPSDDQMDNNKLSGKIPNSLGFCQQVETLNLASNRLNGSIPNEIVRVSSLTNLNLSHNKLWGPLPSEVGSLKQLQVVDVSDNQLSGNLAASIGGCVTLQLLNLSKNNISGGIPGSVGKLTSLEVLDLSFNKFSGPIPRDLENLQYLKKLNLSFNHLEGEVPKGKVFLNLSVTSVQGNNGLCGGDQEIARYLELPQCKTRAIKRYHLLKILVSAAGVTLFLCLIFCFLWALRPGKKKNKVDKDGEPSPSLKGLLPMISYSDIRLATSNFAAENLIGKGGFGSVYKGTFITSDNGANTSNITLAVKALDLQQSKALQSFLAECETLRNIRHRNLMKIITSCFSIDHKGDQFKALLMEFMPSGNLDRWLYPEDMESGLSLSSLQRLNIAIDVASAMEYLHNDCEPPIVHCDLKPANVLLDENMAAYVGDFGLARFLPQHPSQEESSTIGVKGSIGYIAPEYGLGGKASTSGDVYSFGIPLLEMFIAKRPTDGMFKEGLSLNQFESAVDSDQAFEIADPRLFKDF